MQRIVEYTIISANDNDTLAEKVNCLIGKVGLKWEPFGGVAFQRDEQENGMVEWYFQQAMVRYFDNDS